MIISRHFPILLFHDICTLGPYMNHPFLIAILFVLSRTNCQVPEQHIKEKNCQLWQYNSHYVQLLWSFVSGVNNRLDEYTLMTTIIQVSGPKRREVIDAKRTFRIPFWRLDLPSHLLMKSIDGLNGHFEYVILFPWRALFPMCFFVC